MKETQETKYTQKTIGEMAAGDERAIRVFEKYEIDYCCGGQKTFGEACAEKSLDTRQVLQELELASQVVSSPGERYDQWELDFLADYIVNQYHTYTKSMLLRVSDITAKVAEVHGGRHPETRLIAQLWSELSQEMSVHLQKEEMQLFPHIKRLMRGEEDAPNVAGSTQQLIWEMEAEHEAVGESLAEIKALSHGFTPPPDACNTYRALYSYLAEFDQTTKKHVHLENNILFPKAVHPEKKEHEY
jgi:regulator of cell morphogenesis and NO signaling